MRKSDPSHMVRYAVAYEITPLELDYELGSA